MNQLTISDLSILLVEPSPVQRQIIEQEMGLLGVRNALTAGTGAEAMTALRQHTPDLVVSAMYLEDMTGTELVRGMRSDTSLEAIPFMLISSETSFAALDPVRQAGSIAILPKPFASEDLKHALYATLDFIDPQNDGNEIELDQLETLVVDDSSLARKHVIRVLQALGIESISQAQNGREAAEMIENQFFDLVVTDYNMPEMDGEMLTRFIRERSGQRSIPVLMVTSEENEGRLAAVQRAGVSGICDKPFDPRTVKQMIQNLL